MGKFLTFDGFASDFEKLAIYHGSGWVSMTYGMGKDGFNSWMESDDRKLFFYVKDADEYLRKISTIDMPVLIFDWQDKDFVNKVATYKPSTVIYNDPREMLMGKETVLKKMIGDGMDWVPKTVFNFEDAKSLGFPLIAKSRNSYDSKGVEKVENRSELEKYEKYDIFQKIIDIDREFRVITFKGKRFNKSVNILMILEKMPKNDKAKDLRLEEELSKEELQDKGNTKFKWKQLDLSKFEHMDQLEKIVPYIMNINAGLNFTGMDLAVDKEGKMFFIEHNLQPAMMSNQGILLYKAMFEDYYGRQVSDDTRKEMVEMSRDYFEKSKKLFPFDAENKAAIDNIDGHELFI